MANYLLGYDPAEWQRLEDQHALWGPILRPVLDRNGLRAGAKVLDAGCGIGALLADLATAVGPTGHAVGVEVDPASAERARARVPAAEVRIGDLREIDLGGGYDLVVSRWVLSYLPDPAAAVRRLASTLRPGGALVVQDYHHDGMSLFPDEGGAYARMVNALRRAFAESGGHLWIAGDLPALYAAAGLHTREVVPEVRAGGPDSAVWRWEGTFILQHAPGLVRRGLVSEAEHAAFVDAFTRAASIPGATLFSPIVTSVVGIRPAEAG